MTASNRALMCKPSTIGRKATALCGLLAACLPLGCARLPPELNALSGRRIRVTMRFKTAIEPNFYYYFLINKYGTQGTNQASGPIPVIDPTSTSGFTYGNGFATGSLGQSTAVPGLKDYGLTDYIEYHTGISNTGLYLFHFSGDPNIQQQGTPVSNLQNAVVPNFNPSSVDPTASRTISFDLYMSQLVTDTTLASAKTQEANNIQFLQVNIVSTNLVPSGSTANLNKEVDAMGDTLDSTQRQTSLQIDLNQSRTYTSQDANGLPEPTSNDVYPPGSPDQALDLEYWSIEVITG